MKNLLAKFYKSLAFRVALALIATASVANAHDLPQHFPLAPTDWGMIQQDCIGYQYPDQIAIDIDACPNQQLVEFSIAQPDEGHPPAPQLTCEQVTSHGLIGPALYDGVDCAKLESFYRDAPPEHLAEYTPAEIAPFSVIQAPTVGAEFEFHKSFFAACSCDFENRQANQSITPPKFTLKRTYIEDHFSSEFHQLKPLVLRSLTRPLFTESSIEPLATAIPTPYVRNKVLLANALSQIASYDCVARSEFYSCYRAFQLGEFTGSLAKTWIADALPSASHFIADFANSLESSEKLSTPAPMFVIFNTAAGNEVAVPIAQARDWEHNLDAAPTAQKVAISQEFRDLVDSANAKLQWAGGRLSAAASYMNDWFSDRLARVKTDDIR